MLAFCCSGGEEESKEAEVALPPTKRGNAKSGAPADQRRLAVKKKQHLAGSKVSPEPCNLSLERDGIEIVPGPQNRWRSSQKTNPAVPDSPAGQ